MAPQATHIRTFLTILTSRVLHLSTAHTPPPSLPSLHHSLAHLSGTQVFMCLLSGSRQGAIYLFLFLCVFTKMYACIQCVHSVSGSQKRALDLSELKLHIVVSCHGMCPGPLQEKRVLLTLTQLSMPNIHDMSKFLSANILLP